MLMTKNTMLRQVAQNQPSAKGHKAKGMPKPQSSALGRGGSYLSDAAAVRCYMGDFAG